ncbi:hypothetical protein [Reinekea marinisedimentorum]|uniref:FkbM family methyltransferase n=1 Tax=Reinekea marinisedimentorum TaxID=230495 RepID=A0A4R3I9A5_9GAMM|nr:hypothetical protein [Reinekea marinisedimentorum]TCS41950.1 hypothetical protein BCF53_10454 [Reinekea marinisedimentorum]
MNSLKNLNIPLNNVGTIIHIGAGQCTELEGYHQLNAKSIHLVEANPSVAQQLSLKTNGSGTVSVVNKVVAEQTKNVTFYNSVPQQFSSIVEPLAFKKLFKNLKVEHAEVEAIGINDLLQSVSLQEGNQNILVLQLNGAENSILAAINAEWLNKFTVIVVQAVSINDAEMPSAEVPFNDIQPLKAAFALAHEAKESSIFTSYTFVKDTNKLELKALREKNKALQLKCESFAVENNALKKASDDEQVKLQKMINQLELDKSNLSAQLLEITNKAAAFEIDKKNAIARQTQADKNANQIAKNLEAEKAKFNGLLVSQKDQIDSLKTELSNLKLERDAGKTLVAELENQVQTLKSSEEALKKISKELSQNQNCLDAERSQYKSNVARLESTLAEQEQKLLASKQEQKSLVNQISDLQSVSQKETEEKYTFKALASELESQIQTLKSSEEALIEGAKELKQSLDSLKAENSQYKSSVTRLENILAEKEQKLLASAQEQQSLENKINKLQLFSQKESEEKNTLKVELVDATEQLQSARAEAVQANERLAVIEQSLSAKEELLAHTEQELKLKTDKNSALSNELSSFQEKYQMLTEEAEVITVKIGKLQQNLNSLSEEKVNLENSLEEVTKQRDQEHTRYQEHNNWAHSLKEQLEELRAKLEEKDRAVSLGQKMLAKSQIDLDELRSLYAEKVESERGLVDLVAELKEKLTLASKYYFQLQKEHPELLEANNTHEGS